MRNPKDFHKPKKARLKRREEGNTTIISLLVVSLFLGCTVQKTYNININIMTKKKSQLRYVSKWNTLKTRGEKNTLPSLTSQGEGVSMAEMIRRYTRGEIPPLAKHAFHGVDVDINKFGSKQPDDLTEMQEAAEAAAYIDRTSVAKAKATKRKSEADEPKSESRGIEENKSSGSEAPDASEQSETKQK